ncbi:MAG: NUDIX domain-containing protein [Cyanobacteriota bacterium]|nr:NUDIX domain-containing protein [Cyanobacteriota bacterium]
MTSSPPATHQHLAIEAELTAGPCRFVRERLRLPLGQEASFGWLRHPPSVLVVPRLLDGRLLLLRRWRPAVGRWVLEFPSGALEPGESAAAGAARLLRGLIGAGDGNWQPLGRLHPNPGYSDEQMTLGWLALSRGVGTELAGGGLGESPDSDTFQWRPHTPRALEAALSALEEPVAGPSVSAWFLARQREIG